MKKMFVSILTLIYLVSGIGFGSTHHFCHNGQEMRTPEESQCCARETQAGQTPAHSCCDLTGIHVIAEGFDTSSPGDCCDIRHIYNQLEGPSLLIPVDPGLSAKSDARHFYYPQPPHQNDESAPTIHADPLFRLNLPLLI